MVTTGDSGRPWRDASRLSHAVSYTHLDVYKRQVVTTFNIKEVPLMAQKITGYVKLQIPAGKATPAPPVGPALGQHGVNLSLIHI